jgi:hypothetical protein
MEDGRSSKWPWWLIFSIVGGLGVYLGMIYVMGGFRANLISMVFDGVLFFVLLYLWLIFFSQFILPVQTFQERRKIFDRLVSYMGGSRGPVLFVRDGEIVANPDELHRRGPGVIWLDTASGAVTRAGASFKNVFGPGVNFTEGYEYITRDDVVDLHVQIQKIGPGEQEDPFATAEAGSGELKAVQERSLKVSGLTRDGIEIIPVLEVVFKLDTGVVKKGERGSLFGYSKDMEREKADKKAIEKAVIGQAVNPNELSDSNRFQMAWNELPVFLAADLWREYLSKFKLDQLFRSDLNPPQLDDQPQNSPVPGDDLTALSNPVQAGPQGFMEDTLTNMLHGLNYRLKGYTRNGGPKDTSATENPRTESEHQPERLTAVQMINLMIKQRLMEQRVPILNNEGDLLPGRRESEEFKLLKERGIRVLDVSIGGLRVLPAVDTHLVENWKASWLTNAMAEAEQIKIHRHLAVIQGEELALSKYAVELSENLVSKKDKAINLTETARILLMRSRQFLIRNDRAENTANEERAALEEIIQWLETDPE